MCGDLSHRRREWAAGMILHAGADAIVPYSYLRLVPPSIADAISSATSDARRRFAVACANVAVEHAPALSSDPRRRRDYHLAAARPRDAARSRASARRSIASSAGAKITSGRCRARCAATTPRRPTPSSCRLADAAPRHPRAARRPAPVRRAVGGVARPRLDDLGHAQRAAHRSSWRAKRSLGPEPRRDAGERLTGAAPTTIAPRVASVLYPPGSRGARGPARARAVERASTRARTRRRCPIRPSGGGARRALPQGGPGRRGCLRRCRRRARRSPPTSSRRDARVRRRRPRASDAAGKKTANLLGGKPFRAGAPRSSTSCWPACSTPSRRSTASCLETVKKSGAV